MADGIPPSQLKLLELGRSDVQENWEEWLAFLKSVDNFFGDLM
jgi:hypothetical protein